MNFKTTGLLVALLVIIGAVWLFFPKAEPTGPESTPPPVTEELKYLLDPRPKDEQIARVEVERAGKPRLVFERVDGDTETYGSGTWRMLEPLAVPADGNKIMSLVRSLIHLQYRAQFEPGAKGQPTAAEAGLEPPTATVVVNEKEGKQYKFEVGRKAALSTDTYLRLGGDRNVHVVTRELATLIDKDIKDYRVQRLFSYALDDVTRVRMEYEGRTYDFSKGADGEWVINEPVRAYADKAKLRDKLLTPLNTLQAVEFADEATLSPAQLDLEKPFLTAAVTTETKKKQAPADTQPAEGAETQPTKVVQTRQLVVGGFADLKSERRYVKLEEGGIAIVTHSSLANVVPKLNELRDPRVVRVKAADITQIELTVGNAAAVIRKVGEVWQGSGELESLDPEATSQLVEALTGLNAVNYVDAPEGPEKYGLDRPRAVITITATGIPTPLTLRVGGETASGRNAYVQREGEATVLVVTQAQADKVAIDPLTLRSRDVFSFAPERLVRLELQRGDNRYELVRQGQSWKLIAPADAPLDAGAADALATNMSRLRAARVVAKGGDADFGLSQPAVTIHFELAAEPPAGEPPEAGAEETTAVQHTLRAARVGPTTYARRDDDALVFELEDSVYRVLSGELLDTRLFPFQPEQVAGVKVTAPGGTLELAKQEDRWIYVPDPYVELEPKNVQEFMQDLARLRVEAYLAYRDGDLRTAGLEDAPASVTVHLNDGRQFVLNLAQEQPGELPRVAALVTERRICLLKKADAQKLLRGLDAYAKSDKPAAKPDQGQPPEP